MLLSMHYLNNQNEEKIVLSQFYSSSYHVYFSINVGWAYVSFSRKMREIIIARFIKR